MRASGRTARFRAEYHDFFAQKRAGPELAVCSETMNQPLWIPMLVGAALVCGCDEQGQRDVVQAEKNLRETQREAQEDVAKAQEKAEDDIARAEEKLSEAKREELRRRKERLMAPLAMNRSW